MESIAPTADGISLLKDMGKGNEEDEQEDVGEGVDKEVVSISSKIAPVGSAGRSISSSSVAIAATTAGGKK
jgi:hypothetical protein